MISALLYCVSLLLPALVIYRLDLVHGRSSQTEIILGVHCLALGFIAVPWYANLIHGFAAVAHALGSRALALGFSLVAIGLALSTFLYLGRDLKYPHVGYFAWLGSMVALLLEIRTTWGRGAARARRT